jgi:hypothetical protein
VQDVGVTVNDPVLSHTFPEEASIAQRVTAVISCTPFTHSCDAGLGFRFYLFS